MSLLWKLINLPNLPIHTNIFTQTKQTKPNLKKWLLNTHSLWTCLHLLSRVWLDEGGRVSRSLWLIHRGLSTRRCHLKKKRARVFPKTLNSDWLFASKKMERNAKQSSPPIQLFSENSQFTTWKNKKPFYANQDACISRCIRAFPTTKSELSLGEEVPDCEIWFTRPV